MTEHEDLISAGYRESRGGMLRGTPEGYLYGHLAEALQRVSAERDALAAVVEQVRQWRHDWFNEPIEGVKRKPHHRRLDDVLDAAPSVALDHVKAEALREAADGFRLYEDCDSQAVLMVTVENYLNDRADRIEKGESNDQ